MWFRLVVKNRVWKGESGKVSELKTWICNLVGGFMMQHIAIWACSGFLPEALLGPIECPAVWPWILRPVSSRKMILVSWSKWSTICLQYSVTHASQKLIHDLSSPSCVSHRTSLLHVSPGDAIAKTPRLLGPTAAMQRRHIFGRRERCNLQKLDYVYVVGLCSKFYFVEPRSADQKSHTAKTVFKDSNCRAFNLTIATMWASDPLICVTKAAAGAYVIMNKCIHIWIFQVTKVAPCNRGHMSHLISLRRPQPLLLVLASEWNPSWRLKMSLRISRQSH